MLPQPALARALPIARVLRLGFHAPDPALSTPPLPPLVATRFHKRGRFCIGDGARAIRNGATSTRWGHFSFSHTNGWSGVAPREKVPPGIATSPGSGPLR